MLIKIDFITVNCYQIGSCCPYCLSMIMRNGFSKWPFTYQPQPQYNPCVEPGPASPVVFRICEALTCALTILRTHHLRIRTIIVFNIKNLCFLHTKRLWTLWLLFIYFFFFNSQIVLINDTMINKIVKRATKLHYVWKEDFIRYKFMIQNCTLFCLLVYICYLCLLCN